MSLPAIVSQFVGRVLTQETLDEWQDCLNHSRNRFLAAQDDGVDPRSSKECSHNQYLIHKDFTETVEASIDRVCASLDTTSNALYHILRDHMTDPVVEAFLQVVNITTQFEVFADMMRDKEKQKYLFGVLASWRNLLGQTSKK